MVSKLATSTQGWEGSVGRVTPSHVTQQRAAHARVTRGARHGAPDPPRQKTVSS